MNQQKYLVTGGAGFIGSHLVDKLLTSDAARVVVVDNFNDFYDPRIKEANVQEHLNHQNYRLVRADICDYESLQKTFAEEHFDGIIHLAARAGVRPSLSQAKEYYETNVTGTLNLFELARQFEIKKFIFASSSSVYGANAIPPFQEDALLLPISPYAATKAAGETLAHTYSHLYGIQTICFRFFTVYGARQRPDLAIHKFAKLIAEGKPIPVYGDGTASRDYTYVDDIISGVLAGLTYKNTLFEVINLGESKTIILKDLISLLENELRLKAKINWLPAQPGDLSCTHADISKAKRLLNYHPTTDIEVGIQQIVTWFRKSFENTVAIGC